MNVQAVLKVTCLPFKLSPLGLNSFSYYKQEEGKNIGQNECVSHFRR